MIRSILGALAMTLLFVGIAGAKTHTITLYSNSSIAGQELKAGNYKLEIEGEKVTITNGKRTLEPATRLEEGAETYAKTSVRYNEAGGKNHIREIRLGGTNTKLVFSAGSAAPAAGQ
ncbi:MAG: hypothetical protein IT169_11710 [Bryobacterales bacterium]|nr:hypothetical protein [Bryobacterales bacterium]